jgi:hypothetical protein
MKTTLFLFLFLCAGAAFGQTSVSSEAQPIEFASHERHASQQSMARSQDVMETSTSFVGHGQRPLWEVQPAPRVVPLGDIARYLRKEHAAAKKSKVIWEN